MQLPAFDRLHELADGLPAPLPVAVAGGADVTVLEALRRACDRGWVKPTVVAGADEVARLAEEHGIGMDGFTVVDSSEPAVDAVRLVRAGAARLLMKGQVATPRLMSAVLDPNLGLRTGRMICQVVLMELVRSARRFLLADTGVCIQPSVAQKADILRSTVAVAQALGVDRPHVALMAATEQVTESMPETLDAAELQRQAEAGALGRCLARGPLSFDMAFDPAAAARKQAGSDFGAADVMLFPSLLAANLTVKAIMYTAECRFGGVLCGTSCPVVFMSRADTTATRLNSLALALHLAPTWPAISA